MLSSQKMMSAPSGGGSDDNFKNVTLLLNGNGTNGAQNNTFVDSSSNNFTITRNGNTTQGSFSPYGSLWSNYFSGATYYGNTDSRLDIASNAAFDFGTGNFTVEAWVFWLKGSSNSQEIFAISNSSGQQTFCFKIRDNGSLAWSYNVNDEQEFYSSSTITENTWTNVALTRNNGTVRFFINGTVDSNTWSSSYSISSTSRTISIAGDTWLDRNVWFKGYLSNLRVNKGTALYTSSFTPSLTPLTAVSGTSLLTCQSNRFIDNSSNNFTITVYGTPSVQRFSPFNPTAPYDTATIGGSGYFDGSGDYLSVPSNSALQLLSGDFTIECWVYLNEKASGPVILSKGYGGSTFEYLLFCNGTKFVVNIGGASGAQGIFGTTDVQLNTWYYVAVTRTSGTARLFVNGVQEGSKSLTSTNAGSDDLTIGGGNGYYTTGYVTDVRLIKGTGGSSVTVPTAPLTAITNTSLLCKMTNAGIPDYAMMNDLETVGNAQVSTSVKKFGTGSLAFDGTGDELKIPSTSRLVEFGTGNFTIECWFYAGNTTSSIFFDSRNNSNLNNPAIWWSAVGSGFNYPSKIVAYLDDNFRIASGTLSTSTWYHVALVRSGTTVTLYIDGTSAGTYTYSTSVGNSIVTVGDYFNGGLDFTGNIDDLRISKIARYTANFTPPTAALPVK